LAKVGQYFCPYLDRFQQGAQAMGRKKDISVEEKT
jgi:hypothetical protein